MSSELRRDPVSGRWVIVAVDRGKRPTDFRVESHLVTTVDAEACPFCEGHEGLTPPEVLAYRQGSEPNTPGWGIRIVPNKFPALELGGELHQEAGGLFERMDGVGVHEVVIDTPHHGESFATLSESQIDLMLAACQERVRALKADARIRYVIVFKNHGPQAGATREHSHAQLIALPIVPDFVREEVDGSRAYFDSTHRCVFCDVLREERADGRRVIAEHGQVVAIVPYAARSPFEMWLLPKHHGAAFEEAPAAVRESMAGAIKDVLGRMNRALGAPPYNLIVHSAPFGDDYTRLFHWHVEVMPRLSRTAGFEWGTGFYINPTAPESAAATLRTA
jgi:UDPglucose--hexose-1-phosphate uridylyltransferase